MCTPDAYAVFSVAKGVSDYTNDKAQAKAVNNNSARKAESIRNTAIWDDNSLIRDIEVKTQQYANKKLQVANKAKEVLGMANLKISEKGIGGNVVGKLLGQVQREAGNVFSTLDLNYENTIRSINQNRIATNKKYENDILGLPQAYIPTFGSYALRTAMDVSSIYIKAKPPTTPSPQSNWSPDMSWMNGSFNLS